MILILLIAVYCIGVAVEGFLRGIDAAQREEMSRWERGDRERAWLASLLWPLSMWLELGSKFKRWRL
ncbi:hypothetical protein LCGC14_0644020 [marine sediment metagenome]|uniref:Uncharacterized protein n=1 Tax=marine sediment metagenome TaxID=412755 RepID=A0A0F9U6N3_9ZZZZ